MGLVGLASLIGWVGLESLMSVVGIFFLFDLIQKYFQMELLSFMTHKNLMIPKGRLQKLLSGFFPLRGGRGVTRALE